MCIPTDIKLFVVVVTSNSDGGRSLADVRRVIVPLLIGTHITPELGDTYSRFIHIKLGRKKDLLKCILYARILKNQKIRKSENQKNKKNKNLGRNLGRTDHFIFFSPRPSSPTFLPPSLPPEPPATTTTTTTIKEELREFLVLIIK